MSHGENMEKIKNKRKIWLCLPLCEARMVLGSGGEQCAAPGLSQESFSLGTAHSHDLGWHLVAQPRAV